MATTPEANIVDADSDQAVAHTPGRWCICEDVVEDNDILISAEKEASPDGGFPYPIAWMDVEDTAQDELLANARLITAAPNLLEECRRTLDWLSSFSMPPTASIDEKNETIARLESVIAKATGKVV